MSKKETWKKLDNTRLQQVVVEFDHTLSRTFNFATEVVSSKEDLTAGATTTTTNAETFFSDADDGMVREAWEEMQRQGSSFDFHLKPSTRALQRNAQEVGAVVAVGAGHDVAAPEKAAFRRKVR